jgi:archaellum biogenesis protein FlaJ (TadC family)
MRIREQSYVPFIIAAVVTFIVGLAIGATQGGDKTVLNTISAILLTVGAIAVVVTLGLEVVRRTRHA